MLPLKNDDEPPKPAITVEAMVEDEIFRERSSYENEGARDRPWIRRAKYFSISVVLALLFGVGSLIEAMFESDSEQNTAWRFFLGVGLGTAFGIMYAVRCLGKGEDP
jgi:hypothetical protein